MGEEIAFENGRISDFQRLMTLALTLDRVMLHTVMHRSSTSTYIPNFIKIEETFLDGRTYGRTFETHFIRSTRRSRPKNGRKSIRLIKVVLSTIASPECRYAAEKIINFHDFAIFDVLFATIRS